MKVQIQRTDKSLPLPNYAREDDAGIDLYSAEEASLEPGERKFFSVGLRMKLPKGYECQIRPRSGLAVKHGISIVNSPGTIDSGYRGLMGVILINLGKESFSVKRGDRIAQAVFKKVESAEIEEVEEIAVDSARGEGGLGHSDGTGPGFALTSAKTSKK